MSILFADVYDGIQAVRVLKGVCEKDILCYVQEKAGGCMKVGNVLKTIRTLKKLVEDGCLLKVGNRYKLPPKKPQKNDECEEEEEEEEEECEEEDNEELDMDNDECDEGEDDEEEQEDEDEEDDDEEDEEDDEEDDEDEEEGEEEEEDEEDDDNCDKEATNDGEENNSENKNRASADQQENNQQKQCPEIGSTPIEPTAEQQDLDGKTSNNNVCRPSKTTRGVDITNVNSTVRKTENTHLENKDEKDEVVAFCARDFMDSLAKSRTDEDSEEKMDITKEGEEIAKVPKGLAAFSRKKGVPRKKMTLESRKRFRSRSPIGVNNFEFSQLNQDILNDACFLEAEKKLLEQQLPSSRGEDMKMEVETPFDSPRINSDVHIVSDTQDIAFKATSVKESSSGNIIGSDQKTTSRMKLTELKASSYSDMLWYPLEDSGNGQDVLEEIPVFDKKNKKSSLCSLCDKKKRNS